MAWTLSVGLAPSVVSFISQPPYSRYWKSSPHWRSLAKSKQGQKSRETTRVAKSNYNLTDLETIN